MSDTPTSKPLLDRLSALALGEKMPFIELRQLAADAVVEIDRLAHETQALHPDSARLQWLANTVLACDYGDNETGTVGWCIRLDKRDGKPFIYGESIAKAIDRNWSGSPEKATTCNGVWHECGNSYCQQYKVCRLTVKTDEPSSLPCDRCGQAAAKHRPPKYECPTSPRSSVTAGEKNG